MDWQNVSTEDLLDALREVEWVAPRPFFEFVSNISLPKSQAKWASRLKCNAYHYRSNYLLIAAAALALTLLRNPLALLAALFTLMGLLCLNDPFALALNANIMKLVRLAHPATANRMKNYAAPAAALAGSRRSRPKYRIAALPRHLFITLLDALALLLLWRGAALLSLLLALLLALGLPLAHASLRAPNLKARLNSARQEFQAQWRGYQQQQQGHDYTL